MFRNRYSWIETYLVTRLLNSQKFHDMVRKIHQAVYSLRHGQSPPINQDAGARRRGFLDYFKEEIKDQLKGKPRDKF